MTVLQSLGELLEQGQNASEMNRGGRLVSYSSDRHASGSAELLDTMMPCLISIPQCHIHSIDCLFSREHRHEQQ